MSCKRRPPGTPLLAGGGVGTGVISPAIGHNNCRDGGGTGVAGDLASLPPLIREKVMKDKRKPAELIRTDLITAMKIPDTEHLDPDSYWPIVDPWKTDYDKGVQVPVNPEGAPDIVVKQRRDTTARDAILGPFIMPSKLINVTGERCPIFDPARHEFCDPMVKTRMLEARPRYNLDQLDFAWLQLLNRQRGACGLLELTEEVLEMVVDDLETRCHNNMTANQLGIEFDEDTLCDVCLSPDSEEGNDMVFCDACDLCVHQACYGIVTVPAGSWLCAPCARGYSAKPPCALCPTVDGALKPDADADLWAHVTCALWIPEVTIGTPELMEPLQNLHKIPAWRRRLTCSVCSREGQGACIQCSADGCKAAYHVTCAQKAGLSLSMCAADVCDTVLELKSYCRDHARFRNSVLSPHKYKKVIEYGGQAAAAASARAANKQSRPPNATTSSLSPKSVGPGMAQQFLDFVDPNETAAHLRQFVDPLGVDQIFNFWKLKRLERQGRALLPPKHEENGLQRPVQIDDELSAAIRSLVSLRQDLERARNLTYLVQRREKQRKLWIRAREDVTMGQLRAAEEHPESLRIIRTANRLDDVYDRLHSFEKIYGIPADSVVASLMRAVARGTERLRESPIMARHLSPPASSPVQMVIEESHGASLNRLAPAQTMSASQRSTEGRESGTKRKRERHSSERDENDAPLQRVRTRLDFAISSSMQTGTGTPEKQQQQNCIPSTPSNRDKHPGSPPLVLPVQNARGKVTTGSPPALRTSPSSAGSATLKFLRVGRRRGGPFKRSMLPDLQSGSPERPLPATSSTFRPGRSPSQTSPTSSLPSSTTITTTTTTITSSSSSSPHRHTHHTQHHDQSSIRLPHRRRNEPSGGGGDAGHGSSYGGYHNCTGCRTSTQSADTVRAIPPRSRLQPPPERTYLPVNGLAVNEGMSRMTRGRQSLADTPLVELEGHFVRGTPRTPPLAAQCRRIRRNGGGSSIRRSSHSSSRSSTCSGRSHSRDSQSRSNSTASRNGNGPVELSEDSDGASVEILTGSESVRRTRNATRSVEELEPVSLAHSGVLPDAYPTGLGRVAKEHCLAANVASGDVVNDTSPAVNASNGGDSNISPAGNVSNSGDSKISPAVNVQSSVGDDISPGVAVSDRRKIGSEEGDSKCNTDHSSCSGHNNSRDSSSVGLRKSSSEMKRTKLRTLRRRDRRSVISPIAVLDAYGKTTENAIALPRKAVAVDSCTSNDCDGAQPVKKSDHVELDPAATETDPEPARRANSANLAVQHGSSVRPPVSTPAAEVVRETRSRSGILRDVGKTSTLSSSRMSTSPMLLTLPPRLHTPSRCSPQVSPPSATPAAPRLEEPSGPVAPLASLQSLASSQTVAERDAVLVLRSNGKRADCRRRGLTDALQYSVCRLDCTVRLQRLSGAQLQRFVRFVPRDTGRTA